MIKLNQKGFALIEGVLLVAAVALLGFGGYYIYRENIKSEQVAIDSDYGVIAPCEVDGTCDAETTGNDSQEGVGEHESQVVQIAESVKGEITESSTQGWYTYTNNDLGFSFDYPKTYGQITVDADYGTEAPDALLYSFFFDYVCTACEKGQYATQVPMYSAGIIEIGATSPNFGGIGSGRPFAIGDGFDSSLENFVANNTSGYLQYTEDEYHDVHRTTIEFNLTKNPEITGIMFMTNDRTGESSNEANLKTVVSTFSLVD